MPDLRVSIRYRCHHLRDATHLVGEVRSHQVDVIGEVLPGPGHTLHFGLAAEFSFSADLAGDARDFGSKRRELVHHRVDGVLQLENFTTDVHCNFLGQIARGDCCCYGCNVSYLSRQVRGHEVDVVGEVFPRTGHTAHIGLAAELSFGTDLAGDARDFGSKRRELVHHRIDGVFQFKNLAAHVHCNFLGQVAARHCCRHFRDVSHLVRQVGRHEVDVIGKVFPRTGQTLHFSLAAELSFGADFTGDARDFGSKRGELVHHGVDRVLQLEHLSSHIYGNFFCQIAAGYSRGDFGDVADLSGEVGRHEIDVVGEVFPGSGYALHFGLAAEFSFGTDFAGDTGDFGGKRGELVHHRVDGVFQFKDFSAHIHGDFFGEVTAGHGGCHFGDVTYLAGEVRRHRIHVIRQVFPRTGHAAHFGLAAEFSFGTDFAGDAGDFGSKRGELVHHRVDGVLELENFSFHVHRNLLRQVAAGHGGGDLGDVPDLVGEVVRHEIDVVGQVFPRTRDAFDLRLAAELSFGTDFAGDAGDFRSERRKLVHHVVDGVLELENFSFDVHRDLLREVSVCNRGRHVGDVTDLVGQIGCHKVHVIGQVFPGSGHAFDLRLAAELSFGTDLAGDAGDFRGERRKLVHHGVDGVLELENFSFDVHRDLLREVAAGDSRGHLGDVPDLIGEVGRHEVDVVGQVFPGTADALDLSLAAELSFGTDFAGDAGDFRSERRKLVHHVVDGVLELENFSFDVHRDLLREVSVCNRGRHVGDVTDLVGQIGCHKVHVIGQVFPGSGHAFDLRLAAELSFGTDLAGDAGDFRGERRKLVHHGVDGVLELENFSFDVHRDLLREVAAGDSRGHLGDVPDLIGEV